MLLFSHCIQKNTGIIAIVKLLFFSWLSNIDKLLLSYQYNYGLSIQFTHYLNVSVLDTTMSCMYLSFTNLPIDRWYLLLICRIRRRYHHVDLNIKSTCGEVILCSRTDHHQAVLRRDLYMCTQAGKNWKEQQAQHKQGFQIFFPNSVTLPSRIHSE